MNPHYQPPALSAAAKLRRMSKTAQALRQATRAASQKAADNAETVLNRDQQTDDHE